MWNEIEFELTGKLPEGRRRDRMEEVQLLVYRQGDDQPPLMGVYWPDPSAKFSAFLPEDRYALDMWWQIGPEIWKLDDKLAFQVQADQAVKIDLAKSHIDDVQGSP
jgi:hypothetical protein